MEEAKHINHITIQRKEVRWNPDGGMLKVMRVKFKKPRYPRKAKKRFFKLHGYKWGKYTDGWLMVDECGYYPSLSQNCKENN